MYDTAEVEPIDIEFRDQALASCWVDERAARRRWGTSYRKVLIRLALLASAETLSDLEHAPGRCHPLSGDRVGQFALDLWSTYRIVFEPANLPLPKLPQGGPDRTRVTKVRVLGVVDDHGR